MRIRIGNANIHVLEYKLVTRKGNANVNVLEHKLVTRTGTLILKFVLEFVLEYELVIRQLESVFGTAVNFFFLELLLEGFFEEGYRAVGRGHVLL